MKEYLLHILTKNCKLTLIMATLMLASCSSSININEYIDKNSPFDLTINAMDTATGLTKASQTKIAVNLKKHLKLINWLDKNKNGWHITLASYVANISVTQKNSFRLLCTKNDNGIVIGLHDKQYSKSIQKGEIDFLTK